MADTDNIPGSSFTLAEEGGVTLELKGRALPYLPLTVSGRQRAEFTWYPGSPQATVQMLGPEEGEISITGYWKDRFLAGSQDAVVSTGGRKTEEDLIVDPGASGALTSVADLVAQVDSMRRAGRLIRLSWEGLVRYGHITGFTQTWNTAHDVAWSLDFAVVSQEPLAVRAVSSSQPTAADAAVASAVQAGDMAQTAATAPTAASAITDTATTLTQLPAPLALPDWLRGDKWRAGIESQGWVRATADWIQWGANSYANIAQQTTSVIQFAPNLVRDTVGFASGIVSQLSRTTGNTIDAAITEYFAVTTALGVTSQDQVPFGIQLGARSYLTQVNNIIRAVRTSNAVWRYEYTQQMQGDVGTVFIAPNNMDLRDVSTIFYGNQNQWAQLMLYNEFESSRLRAGQEVRIPADAPYGPVGSTGGGGSR